MWTVYGIYRGRSLVYVGITGNFKRRAQQHRGLHFNRQRDEIKVFAIVASEAKALKIEERLISLFRPPRNIAKNESRKKGLTIVKYQRENKVIEVRMRDGMMPLDEAYAIWTSGIPTLEAIRKMPGWSVGKAYRVFG